MPFERWQISHFLRHFPRKPCSLLARPGVKTAWRCCDLMPDKSTAHACSGGERLPLLEGVARAPRRWLLRQLLAVRGGRERTGRLGEAMATKFAVRVHRRAISGF